MIEKDFNNVFLNLYKNKHFDFNYDSTPYLYAIKNKLLYFFCKNIEKNETQKRKFILKEAKRLLLEKNKTLDCIHKLSKEKNLKYKNFKNNRFFQDVNADVDILVKKKDFHKWTDLLVNKGFKKKKHKLFLRETSPYQKVFIKDGFCKLDLTIHYDYNQFDYFSDEYLWNKEVSDLEKEVLIMSLAIIFKRKYINLNDFFLVLNFLEKNKFSKKSIAEMKKFNWYETMKVFISEIKRLKNILLKIKFPYFSWKLFFSVLIFQIRKFHKFPIMYWSYFLLAQLRNFLFYNGDNPPFHVFWIPYKKIK